MRPETIQSYVRTAPFRPFRMHLASGHVYEVRHTEMIRVGRDSVQYFIADPPDAPFEDWETISLLLIERVDHVPAAAPAGGNGSGE